MFTSTRKRSFLIGFTIGSVASFLLLPSIFDQCNYNNGNNELFDYDDNGNEITENNHTFNLKEVHLNHDWFVNLFKSDFNPVVNLNPFNLTYLYDKNKKFLENRPLVRRHRFYSTELNIKQRLFIAVLCDNYQELNFYRETLNKSLQYYDYKLNFFINGKQFNDYNLSDDSFIIKLETNSTEQISSSLNSFMDVVLHYLLDKSENYLNKFDFIFLINANIHIQLEKFFKFFDNQSASKNFYFYNNFSLPDYNNNNSLKEKLFQSESSILLFHANLLKKCKLDKICWKKFEKILPNIYLNDLKHNHKNIDLTKLNETIFTYNFKTINEFNQIELLSSKINLVNLYEKKVSLEFEMKKFLYLHTNNHWPIGFTEPYKPINRFEVIRWQYFNETHKFMLNDNEEKLTVYKINKFDLINLNFIKKFLFKIIIKNKTLEEKISFKNIYQRFDSGRGHEYLIDFKINDFNSNELKRLQILKPLNDIKLLNNIPYVNEYSKVIITIPILSKTEFTDVKIFLKNFCQDIIEKSSSDIALALALVYRRQAQNKNFHFNINNNNDIYRPIKAYVAKLKLKYKNLQIIWITIRSVDSVNELILFDLFSSKLASFSSIDKSITLKQYSNAIIFYTRVNSRFTFEFINRIRMNTIKNFQLFLPVPFIEYINFNNENFSFNNFNSYNYVDDLNEDIANDKELNEEKIIVKKDNGHFYSSYNESIAFYLDDYLNARKFLSNNIDNVNNHYNSLLSLFLNYNCKLKNYHQKQHYNRLNIMKAIDAEFHLQMNRKQCDQSEFSNAAINQCKLIKDFSYGSKSRLASILFKNNL